MPELAVLIAAASLGAMAFFSAVVAPTVFQTLPGDHAGNFLRAVFPKYFLINGIAATIAGLIAFDISISALPIAAGMAMVAVRYFAIPLVNQARDRMLAGVAGAEREFAIWHRIAVIVNALAMLCLAIAICVVLFF